MVYLSGWRVALGLLLALAVALLLLSAIVWLAVLVAIVVGVAWLNLVFLPRIARRLRVRRIVLDLVCLVLLAGVGWLLNGTSGVAVGAAGWLVGVAVPRLLGWRLRERVRMRTSQWRTDALSFEPRGDPRETRVWRWEDRRP